MVCCLEQYLTSSMLKIAEALRTAQTRTTEGSYGIAPLVNRNGWVNPEDLASMPQCIAQQDPSENPIHVDQHLAWRPSFSGNYFNCSIALAKESLYQRYCEQVQTYRNIAESIKLSQSAC